MKENFELERAKQVIDFIQSEISKPLPREVILERVKIIIGDYKKSPPLKIKKGIDSVGGLLTIKGRNCVII